MGVFTWSYPYLVFNIQLDTADSEFCTIRGYYFDGNNMIQKLYADYHRAMNL